MKTKIALITGGYTGEAEISFKSSDFVYQNLKKDKYDVFTIIVGIDQWYYVGDNGVKYEVNKNDFTLQIDDHLVTFDMAFIMLHGTPGEDGRLQGYLDMVGVPYTSCDALTSALTMNKAYTKAIVQDIEGLDVAKSILLFADHRAQAAEIVSKSLELPFFVKPNAGGSSIGMSKVNELSALQEALDKAFDAANTGQQVIVEEFVSGREFSVGVYRQLSGELKVLPSTEIITSREFFDFEAKYTPGITQEITPADLTPAQVSRVEHLVKEIYIRLNCRGMVRVDYFLERDSEKFYFIEINTIPGQTATSFIPQQVLAAGIDIADFYEELIEARR